MSLILMKERIKCTGNTPRNSKIIDAHRILEANFKNDTAYAAYVFFWIPGECPHKGEHLNVKLYDKKYSSANGNTVVFQTQISEKVEVGDYIYNEEDDTYWICTESFNVENIHYKGKFTQCNWYLRWQKADGTILEYPCQDLNSTQYNSGESGNNTIKLGSAQHMETIQATNDTLALASPQRFYVSRTNCIPFIVTQNDTTAYNYGKGLCKLTLTQDTKRSEKDRPDLGICDYHAPSPEPPAPDETTDLCATISGGTTLRCGRAKTWTVAFKDADGNEVSNCDFTWNIVSGFDITKVVEGNKIQLKVDDEDCVDSSILLQIIMTNNNSVIAELEITIIEGL